MEKEDRYDYYYEKIDGKIDWSVVKKIPKPTGRKTHYYLYYICYIIFCKLRDLSHQVMTKIHRHLVKVLFSKHLSHKKLGELSKLLEKICDQNKFVFLPEDEYDKILSGYRAACIEGLKGFQLGSLKYMSEKN